MIGKKNIFFIILFVKFTILFNYFPNLEIERYNQFFEQCSSLRSCLNPYEGILSLDKQFLTFPYSNLMYFILLPFYLIGNYLGLSYVNLAYLLFEVLLVSLLGKIYQIKKTNFIFILILNPLLIYSVSFLGQLDFIPLTLFLYSLYFLKIKKKYYSILFIILAISSKIIFLILLPPILLYFLKLDENSKHLINTLTFTISLSFLFNIQLFFDKNYLDTVLYGINEGYAALNSSSNLLNNNFLFIAIFLGLIMFIFWKNIHRLDFSSVSLFVGFMTIPLFMTNIDNLGWFLWSYPLLVVVYFSYPPYIKLFLYSFLIILVAIDYGKIFTLKNPQFRDIPSFVILSGCMFLIYYAYQVLINNKYYQIKSSPIIISITGDSAVGKTTLSKSLNSFFGPKFVDTIELDSFHLYERSNIAWDKNTHLNPSMNDLNRYKETIMKLLQGENSMVKNYNHLTGEFDSESKKQIKNFLVIEGLHSLHFNDLTEKYDLNVYLELENKLKFETKLSRDKLRGRKKEDIEKQIYKRKSDYEEYIKPQADLADLYIITKSRDHKMYILEICFKFEYFEDFKDLVSCMSGVNLFDEVVENKKIYFNIGIDSNATLQFYKILTSKVDNLGSLAFKPEDYTEEENNELLSKLGVVLFMLEKKISEKI